MLLNEGDQNRRSVAYTLPQQFAGLRAALGEVVEAVFTESKANRE
jgi:type VI protein secretion system component VasK